MRALIIGLGLLIVHTSDAQETCGSLESAEWLIGHWLSDEGDKHFEETWKKVSDATFEGSGITTRKSDKARIDGESLRLVQMGREVFYVSKVAHNDFPVGFKLVQCADKTLVFANPTHDFPKRLEYQSVDPNTLRVHVSDGAQKGFTLTYRREKK
jgi:hypothetical protein